MKNLRNHVILLAFLALSFSLSSCHDSIFGIKGDGPIVEQEFEFNDLKGVNASISGNVHLTQGDEQKVVIAAQQNIIDNIETDVSSGIVNFEFDRNVKNHDGLDIYMTVKTLSHAGLSGSGNINTTNYFETNEILSLNLSGSGNFNVQADALEVYSNMSGSGNFNITTNTDYLDCGISGSGNYNLIGTATEADFSISGSGNYAAFELETDKTTVHISGSGDMRVHANEELNVKISGSGTIYYRGHPDINQDVSGSGSIRNAN